MGHSEGAGSVNVIIRTFVHYENAYLLFWGCHSASSSLGWKGAHLAWGTDNRVGCGGLRSADGSRAVSMSRQRTYSSVAG